MNTIATNTHHARGVLAETAADSVTVSFPGTNYRLRLRVYQPPTTPVGKRIIGSIRVQAKRVDNVHTGGRYVEPLEGSPRRVQGEVITNDVGDNTLVINAGIPIFCKLTDPRQNAGQFKAGDLISCEVAPGASFAPALG
ncbi:MAG: hypothetical protein JNK58_03930 [Phycisphaerae bacterium]|nr:hypothetical protein [Phycisphaerae bacterium]